MAEQPENERVVAVFPDEHAAGESARAARAAGAEDVHLGDSQDEVAALQSEMQEEAAEARPGFFKPEMARSVPLCTAVGALVGVLVALPAAFTGAENVPLATRLLVGTFVGAAVGGTIGFFFGVILVGGLGRRRKTESALAAERGVVVGAEESTDEVVPKLATRDPIRLDKGVTRR